MLFIAYKTLDCLMLEEGVKRKVERSSRVPFFFRKHLIDGRFISSIGFRPMLSTSARILLERKNTFVTILWSASWH